MLQWSQVCVHLASYLRRQCVVVCGLAGEQDVREALLLPHHDVSESTVALVLSHIIPEPLVKHVTFLLSQLPLYWAVQLHLSVGERRAWRDRDDRTGQYFLWLRTIKQRPGITARAVDYGSDAGRLTAARLRWLVCLGDVFVIKQHIELDATQTVHLLIRFNCTVRLTAEANRLPLLTAGFCLLRGSPLTSTQPSYCHFWKYSLVQNAKSQWRHCTGVRCQHLPNEVHNINVNLHPPDSISHRWTGGLL